LNPSRRRGEIALVITAIVLWGCGSVTPAQSGSATELPADSTPATSTPSPTQVDQGVIDGVGELDTLFGVTVVTVTDRLRVRSAPRIGDDSIKYEPLLPLGTSLYAFNGPVYESGYGWYEVALVSLGLTSPGCGTPQAPCREVYSGWAARSGHDGELWLAPGEADCPPRPTDVRGVVTATLGARLACFSRTPITFQARLIRCNCDVDGGGFQPSWFGVDDQPLLLVDPSDILPPADYDDWLIVALDPAGRHPDTLPVGEIVEVTGMFDHPAAQDCLYGDIPTDEAGPPTWTSACRFIFATTSIAAAQS
jgi:hypothetical protein